jgi:hypothetical protein
VVCWHGGNHGMPYWQDSAWTYPKAVDGLPASWSSGADRVTQLFGDWDEICAASGQSIYCMTFPQFQYAVSSRLSLTGMPSAVLPLAGGVDYEIIRRGFSPTTYVLCALKSGDTYCGPLETMKLTKVSADGAFNLSSISSGQGKLCGLAPQGRAYCWDPVTTAFAGAAVSSGGLTPSAAYYYRVLYSIAQLPSWSSPAAVVARR